MYIGIDLGTSGIKVILLGDNAAVIDSASAELVVSRPQPLWSEQAPEHWWQALQACGVSVSFLCPDDVCRFYAGKYPGNAVPPLLARKIAHVVARFMDAWRSSPTPR